MHRPAFTTHAPLALQQTGAGSLCAHNLRSTHVAARVPRRARAPPIVCFGGAADEDDDDDEVTVVLRDEANGKSIICGVEHTVKCEGETYCVCYPRDDVVVFARVDDGELEAVENEELIGELFQNASAVLAEDDLVLVNSAFVLTIEDEGDCDEDGDDDDESRDEDFDDEFVGDGDSGEVEIIAEFMHKGEEYFIAKALDSVLIVARQTDSGLVVPEPDELDRITPFIEDHIEAYDPATAN